VQKDSSQALEQNDWKEFKPLFGGGKIKICDTLRAVTPFWRLVSFDRAVATPARVKERCNS
jgi:hypothetical protein